MKKRSKIITTMISLVLVISFMTIGILAATSATAGISSQISWSAVTGLDFTIDAWTYYSAEHYDETTKSFPEISPHKIDTIVVDTATTNAAASGIEKSLNCSFIDVTDDGVNNPKELYFFYFIKNNMEFYVDEWTRSYLALNITKQPFSKSNVNVVVASSTNIEIGVGEYEIDDNTIFKNNFDTIPVYDFKFSTSLLLIVKLTVQDTDSSVNSFDASISLSFSEYLEFRE